MQERKEKKKYKKKKNFKINIIFNEEGEASDKIKERAFWNYGLKKNKSKIIILNEIIWYNKVSCSKL